MHHHRPARKQVGGRLHVPEHPTGDVLPEPAERRQAVAPLGHGPPVPVQHPTRAGAPVPGDPPVDLVEQLVGAGQVRVLAGDPQAQLAVFDPQHVPSDGEPPRVVHVPLGPDARSHLAQGLLHRSHSSWSGQLVGKPSSSELMPAGARQR
ncbi:hypothetical protein DQ239_07230 [Blastococcus sp. TF02-09]|nr:hypothetical protein DQ239_07230 [Blastococcus sp. TF02-9]